MSVQGDNSLFFSTGLDNSGLKQGSLNAVGMIQGMAGEISKINPFTALAVGATAAFAIIANDAYNLAKEFEHAMKEVETISDATRADFKGISSEVFALSKISPDGPKELANAYYQIVSAGYDGAAGLNLLEVSAKAAVAGVTDTQTAADGLTTALNSYKISAEKSGEVSDAFFNTVKLGKTTFSELAASISQVAPIAAASNIPLNEVLSTVASLTKQGVPTAQAMTQIRSAIVGMQEAGKLDGSKTLQENMQALYNEMNGNQTAIQKEVGRVEALQAILAVSGKNAKSAGKDLKSYNSVIGSTERAFETMANSNINQWKILSNRIKASTEGIGNDVLEMSSGIAKSLNGLFDDTISDSEKLKKSFDGQRLKVFQLKTELEKLDKEGDERKAFVEDMISLYPEFLKGIDIEKVSNEELLGVLDNVNESYKIRYKLAKRQGELNEALINEANAEINVDDEKQKLYDLISEAEKFADDNGVKLKVDYSLSGEVLAESLSKQIAEAQKIAATKGVDINSRYADQEITDNLKVIQAENSFAFRGQVKHIENANQKLIEQKEIVAEINDKNEKALTLDLKIDKNREEAIRSINKASSVKDISKFKDSGFKDIEKAYQDRVSFFGKLDQIHNAKKKSDLTEFLNSENVEVKEAAEKKRDALNKIYESRTKKEVDAYIKMLQEKKTAYDSYAGLLHNGFAVESSKFKDSNSLQYDSYQEYLNNKLAAAKTNAERIQLIEEGAGKREKATGIKFEGKEIKLKSSGLQEVSFADDYRKTIKILNSDLLQFENDLLNSTSEIEREKLAIKIQFKKEEIDLAKGVASKVLKVEENNYDFLGLLSLKKLKQKKKEAEEELKIAKEKAKKEAALSKSGQATTKTQNEVTQLEDNLLGVAESFGGALSEVMSQVSSGLSGAADLFSKFGDDETAALLGQLSGVADGVGKIASGDIVGGSIDILKSALTVEVVSDTAKFEEAIKDLEKVSLQISNNIKNTVGVNQSKEKLNYLESIEETKENLFKAEEAERNARKQVKILGIKAWKKGSGSGTDQAKIEEFQAQAEAAKQEIIELTEEYDAFITNTSRDTLADSIFEGLKEGKKGIVDFAETFEKLIGDSVLNTFKREKLAQISQDFLSSFGAATDTDKDGESDLTKDEIEALRKQFNENIEQATSDFEEVESFLKQAGIDLSLSSEDESGLTGAVRREITEETGSSLEGLTRGSYDNGKRLLALAEQEATIVISTNNYAKESERHLSNIVINTANTVAELKLAVVELRGIKDNTAPSSTSRDLGY